MFYIQEKLCLLYRDESNLPPWNDSLLKLLKKECTGPGELNHEALWFMGNRVLTCLLAHCLLSQ